jgi:tetratricopeptide (TPR) repeat protein
MIYPHVKNNNMKTIRLIMLLVTVIFTTVANAQQTAYYPKLLQFSNDDMGKAKTEFADILKVTEISYKTNPKSYPKKASVFDDRIELIFKKFNATFYFSDLAHYTIQMIHSKNVKKVTTKDSPVPVSIYEFEIKLGDFVFSQYSWSESISSDQFNGQLADYLFFFQYQVNIKRYDSLITAFKPLASEYCALKVKPTVTEEQRKYIVQANALNQQKMYEKAIELYNKAIEIDQTAYPAAYSNLALLSAQLQKFDAAIYYMKKYLLLEPEASEARSAQDKIYEWEIMMQK